MQPYASQSKDEIGFEKGVTGRQDPEEFGGLVVHQVGAPAE